MIILNNVVIYQGDLTNEDRDLLVNNCKYIAVDTETTGLNPLEDKLCLIQIYTGEKVFIIKYNDKVSYLNLTCLLENKHIAKIFHHANFDLRFLIKNLETDKIENVVCTKVAAKLLNGVNENSSLKNLIKKYLSLDIDKSMQTSNWNKTNLSVNQIEYATNDVIYLFNLWQSLEPLLKQKGLYSTAKKCFEYLPTNAKLHNQGIENIFIY